MELSEARQEFIDTWGLMATNWGINKTMGQIHALLLVSTKPLNTDEIMDTLDISRGNVHLNVITLIEWELIKKIKVEGSRKDFYEAEKDLWTVLTRIIKERKKKELEPMINAIYSLKDIEGNCKESDEFCKVLQDIHLYSTKADSALEHIISSKSSWLMGNYLKYSR